MRVGVMIGPERGDIGAQGRQAGRRHRVGRVRRHGHRVDAADPQRLRRADDRRADGRAHQRIELGTAVVPLQAQHPIALARQALSVHAIADGRLALGVGPSHHWIVRDMLGLPYEKPAAYTRDYLEVLNAALAGPGPVDVENDSFTVHNPLDPGRRFADAGAGRRAGSGDAADRGRARRRHGAVDGRRTRDRRPHRPADHQGRRRRRAPGAAHRRGHPGMPVCATPKIDAAQGAGQPDPRRGRDVAELPAAAGPGRRPDVGDLCAAGDEEAILARFTRFADAGVTDLSVRLLPIGDNRDELIASKYRTREVIAELAASKSR